MIGIWSASFVRSKLFSKTYNWTWLYRRKIYFWAVLGFLVDNHSHTDNENRNLIRWKLFFLRTRMITACCGYKQIRWLCTRRSHVELAHDNYVFLFLSRGRNFILFCTCKFFLIKKHLSHLKICPTKKKNLNHVSNHV